jgi:hypothetical protein
VTRLISFVSHSSIVAVHGLGGDSFSTWTDKGSKCLWLRDILPQVKSFNQVRIMTFGYDARSFIRPFQESSTARTFTFAEAILFDLFNARSTPEVGFIPILNFKPLSFVTGKVSTIDLRRPLTWWQRHQECSSQGKQSAVSVRGHLEFYTLLDLLWYTSSRRRCRHMGDVPWQPRERLGNQKYKCHSGAQALVCPFGGASSQLCSACATIFNQIFL